MEGYKTYIGLLITVLGLFGLGYVVSADQLGVVIDSTLKIIGVVMAVYGNIKSHQKIAQLKRLAGINR